MWISRPILSQAPSSGAAAASRSTSRRVQSTSGSYAGPGRLPQRPDERAVAGVVGEGLRVIVSAGLDHAAVREQTELAAVLVEREAARLVLLSAAAGGAGGQARV